MSPKHLALAGRCPSILPCIGLLSCLTTACHGAAPTATPNSGTRPATENRWEKAIRAFQKQDQKKPPPSGAILFVGSSSIRGWDLAKSFPKLETINRGFGGSQFCDAVHFAERIILPYRPKIVVVYDGDNDLAAGKTPEQVFDDCKALVGKIRKALPETKIVLLSTKICKARWNNRQQVRKINAMIEDFAKSDPRVIYVDVATPLLDAGGEPRDELFRKDALHLSDRGYRLWASIINKHLIPEKP
ncbi:MAG: hypothetical protein JXQ73_03400 [Phycisphaerae bacterium]|nr:hypothetical protein [Phycisphaerae bacterium]